MTLFCLTHSHDNGVDSYLFEADTAPDAGEIAAQLGIDFVLQGGKEDIVVSVVANAEGFSPNKSDSSSPRHIRRICRQWTFASLSHCIRLA